MTIYQITWPSIRSHDHLPDHMTIYQITWPSTVDTQFRRYEHTWLLWWTKLYGITMWFKCTVTLGGGKERRTFAVVIIIGLAEYTCLTSACLYTNASTMTGPGNCISWSMLKWVSAFFAWASALDEFGPNSSVVSSLLMNGKNPATVVGCASPDLFSDWSASSLGDSPIWMHY